MAGDDLATAANHHFVDITPDPDILMAVGDRHGIVVGLERTSDWAVTLTPAWSHASKGDAGKMRMAARSRSSRSPIVSLSPRSLSPWRLRALRFQPDVERLPCWKLWDRDHKVAPAIADETLDIPFIVALPGRP